HRHRSTCPSLSVLSGQTPPGIQPVRSASYTDGLTLPALQMRVPGFEVSGVELDRPRWLEAIAPVVARRSVHRPGSDSPNGPSCLAAKPASPQRGFIGQTRRRRAEILRTGWQRPRRLGLVREGAAMNVTATSETMRDNSVLR